MALPGAGWCSRRAGWTRPLTLPPRRRRVSQAATTFPRRRRSGRARRCRSVRCGASYCRLVLPGCVSLLRGAALTAAWRGRADCSAVLSMPHAPWPRPMPGPCGCERSGCPSTQPWPTPPRSLRFTHLCPWQIQGRNGRAADWPPGLWNRDGNRLADAVPPRAGDVLGGSKLPPAG